MSSGGKRPGAGRPAGVRNRKTMETIQAIEQSGLTPLDYMLSVMRNTGLEPTMRLDAAKAAAPYCHARLASSEVTLTQPGDELSAEEIREKLANLLADDPGLLARVMPRH